VGGYNARVFATLPRASDSDLPTTVGVSLALSATDEGVRMSLRKPKDEGERWVAVSLMSFAIFAALLVVLAIVPSYWLYFADGTLKWTSVLMAAVRDIIVSGYYVVALVAIGVAVVIWNRRNPRVLPGDEAKREATGGYK
jgi:hypothetical protein